MKSTNKIKVLLLTMAIVIVTAFLTSCTAADVVSNNISKQADNFSVYRKITVVNMRTDTLMFQVEGYMSLKNNTTNELTCIVQTGKDTYKKHFIYLNDWTSYIVEDLENTTTDPHHWEVHIYTPIPDISVNR